MWKPLTPEQKSRRFLNANARAIYEKYAYRIDLTQSTFFEEWSIQQGFRRKSFGTAYEALEFLKRAVAYDTGDALVLSQLVIP